MFLGFCSLFASLDGIVRSQAPASSVHASQKAAIPYLTLGPDPTTQALTDTGLALPQSRHRSERAKTVGGLFLLRKTSRHHWLGISIKADV
ncbi:hypothetical protein C7999DRAFT_31844 [Corynascus novoguineensis]|uniref:Secreted protein n=1 Tax=Corynascus novoguineensis TaxID=1126955 RepID=A0AAN7CV23_9PEZI|nr:hypothetical protein C7999DRAFT_31844 [Corynascus novoguineensis]